MDDARDVERCGQAALIVFAVIFLSAVFMLGFVLGLIFGAVL